MTLRTFRGSGTSIITVDEHGAEDAVKPSNPIRSSNPNMVAAKQRRISAIFKDRRPQSESSDEPTGEPGLTAV